MKVRVNSGRGKAPLYQSWDPHYISIERMFSGRLPEDVDTTDNGINKLYYAEAIQFDYIVKPADD